MLKIIHSNRLERLADRLIDRLRQEPPGPFEAECILVQNPGMKRWLQQAVARRLGVAAQLDFPLPSRFVWDLYEALVDDPGGLSQWDADSLRWHLMRELEAVTDDERFAPLRPYLERDRDGVRRWQLAERLAGLFDQYQVYRPEMIVNWEQGSEGHRLHEAWQAELWRRVSADIREPHRVRLIQRLIDALGRGEIETGCLPRRVSLFAISSLSRIHLEVFESLSRHAEVTIYHLNPSREFWGDIRSRKESLKSDGEAWSENELLASLGAQGREFIDLLYEVAPNAEDEADFELPAGEQLLAQLQRQMLTLQPADGARLDDSIRFVSSYSDLRELQALHDQLLDYLSADPGLQPHDIVVMHPEIDRIAPMVEAVFGQQPPERRIPFSLSDHRELETDPLLRLLIDWLGLPQSRFTANEILGWLELPALQRRYELAEEDLEQIRYWVRELHIHWARDGEHRAQLKLGGGDLYSWKRGLDRLLAAALVSEEVMRLDELPLPDILPGQGDLQLLGRLKRLIDDLWSWRQRLDAPTDIAGWQRRIIGMIDRLLDPGSEEEPRLQRLRKLLEQSREQAEQAGFREKLGAAWMQRHLESGLQQQQAQHQYLSGGVTFSNLIPMRMLPFRVVCLLGMNDDSFPRRDLPLQFDLVASGKHRIGDRSRRDDDRYLFLQALLSAGDFFLVSWVGRDRRDDSSLEPSVMVRQLMDEIEAVTGERPNVIEKPLQAFSPRAFEQGSHAASWWPDPAVEPPAVFASPIELPPDEGREVVRLEAFRRFFRNPAQYFLQQRLNLRLGIDQDEVDDDEAFALDGLQQYPIRHRMIESLLRDETPDMEYFLQTGELPPGLAGRQALGKLHEEARSLVDALKADADYASSRFLDVRYEQNGFVLDGRVETHSGKRLLQFSESRASGKVRFSFWIDHCLYCYCHEPTESRLYCRNEKGDKPISLKPLSRSEAEEVLSSLAGAWHEGQKQPIPFYPDSAWLYVEKRNEKDRDSAWTYIKSRWTNEYRPVMEMQDDYVRTALKPRQLPGHEFEDWSVRLMQPLYVAIEQDEGK